MELPKNPYPPLELVAWRWKKFGYKPGTFATDRQWSRKVILENFGDHAPEERKLIVLSWIRDRFQGIGVQIELVKPEGKDHLILSPYPVLKGLGPKPYNPTLTDLFYAPVELLANLLA